MGTNNAINANETTPLGAINGGTGASSPTANTIPIAQGASAYTFIGPLTNGQLLIGSTGLPPVATSITFGTGLAAVAGAGTLSISVVTGGLTWTNVTGATQVLSVNNGYLANRAGGNVAFTLPVVSVLGDTIKIFGRQNLFSIAQAAGQQIIFGSKSTTVGVTGSVVSKQAKDCVSMVCTVANTEWEIVSAVGNLDVN